MQRTTDGFWFDEFKAKKLELKNPEVTIYFTEKENCIVRKHDEKEGYKTYLKADAKSLIEDHIKKLREPHKTETILLLRNVGVPFIKNDIIDPIVNSHFPPDKEI